MLSVNCLDITLTGLLFQSYSGLGRVSKSFGKEHSQGLLKCRQNTYIYIYT